jgi:hypothetical protein
LRWKGAGIHDFSYPVSRAVLSRTAPPDDSTVGTAMRNMPTRKNFAGQSSPRLCSRGERAKRRPACGPRRVLERRSGVSAIIAPVQGQLRRPVQRHRLSSCPGHPLTLCPLTLFLFQDVGRAPPANLMQHAVVIVHPTTFKSAGYG